MANFLGVYATAQILGAVGDGVTNDTAAFAQIDTDHPGRIIDLVGLTYLVDAIPTGAEYINGTWLVGSEAFPAKANDHAITADVLESTGEIGPGYSGGVVNDFQIAGRSTDQTVGILLSSACLSEFVRSFNLGSIYSWSKGNVSGNVASRQCVAGSPQSINIASEETWVWGGFRGAHLSSHFSSVSGGGSGSTISARYSGVSGRHGAAMACVDSYVGRGNGAAFDVVLSGDAVDSLSVRVAGQNYVVGDPFTFYPRESAGVGAVATVGSVDASGGVLTVTVSAGGSGYSGIVDATIDNDTGDFAAVIATDRCSAEGGNSLVAASRLSVASGPFAFVAGSDGSTASGESSVVVGGDSAEISGLLASSFGATNIQNASTQSVALGGRGYVVSGTRTIATGGGVGVPSTANRTFEVDCDTGNVRAAGTVSGSAGFADTAYMFENLTEGLIPLGTLVALDGDKVRTAHASDDVFGAVSPHALIVANDSPFSWAGRYMTGDFGEELYEDILDPDWEPQIEDPDWPTHVDNPDHPVYDVALVRLIDGGLEERQVIASDPMIPNPAPAPMIPNPEPQELVTVKVANPDYDPTQDNIPRSERPDEWSKVGIMGKLHIRCGQDLAPGDYIKSDDYAKAVTSLEKTSIRCMAITKPYDAATGYGVALCFKN